jgi:hypothetical protein
VEEWVVEVLVVEVWVVEAWVVEVSVVVSEVVLEVEEEWVIFGDQEEADSCDLKSN